MSISTAQYIDLLFKKLQGVAKTATATQKSASNESIASPALLRGDIVWTQADQIPGTAQVVANVTQGYLTTSRIECTADNTVPTIGGIYPTWLTNLQYWIPQEFGSTWPVKVYVDTAGAADPTVTGTQIFAPGISGVGEFFFDTQAGVLNFIGETIPSTLTAGKSIFITGYRYVGQLGVTNLPSANIGNIQITGNTIATLNANGDLVFDPNGSGSVIILANTSVTGNITATGLISATGNVTGNYFIGNGSQLTGVTASSVDANALTGNTLSSNVLYSSLTSVGTLTSLSVSGNVTGGNLLTAGLISTTGTITSAADITGNNLLTGGTTSATGNITGGNLLTAGLISATSTITSAANITGGNVLTSGLISATADITGGNLVTTGLATVTGNITGGNVLTSGLISSTGNITGNNLNAAGLSLSGNVLSVINSTSNITTTANAAIGNLLTDGLYHANGVAWDFQQPAGSNTQIQYNDGSGGFGASANFTFNDSTQLLSVGGAQSVTGNITSGNLLTGGLISSTGTITSTANVAGGNITTGGQVSATGNITSGNLLTGSLSLSANVISEINTTSNITTTANISSGNVLTSRVSASGNVDGANINVGTAVYTSNIIGKTNALTLESISNGNINLFPNGSGNIVLANTIINGLADPLQSQDAATKYYVDNAVTTGFAFHQPVFAATNTTLATATGGVITYAQPNGVANGIGATITTTGSFNLIDTANVQTANTRILVKNEANAVLNGVYVWSNATVITRSVDADQYGSDSAESFSINDYFFTQSGNVNAGTAFIVNAPAGTITFGTSNITFAEFSSTQVYSANTSAGLSLVGTVFSAKVDNTTTAFDGGGNIVVKASAQLTTPNIGAATGDSLSVTGLITGGNITAGTGYISTTGNVDGGNINTGGLITATGNIVSSANVAGGNILTSGLISATATITGGNLATGGTASASGNVAGANIITSGLVTAIGNVIGGNITTAGLISATDTITGGNLATGGTASATGNITGGNVLTGGLISATSDITSAANVIGGNITSAGLASITGNITSGNVLTGGLISATGNITSAANIAGGNILGGSGVIVTTGNIIGGNILFGAGVVSGTGNIAGGNILTVGIVSTSGNVYGNAILSDYYYYANGTPVPPGIIYTANTAPPTSPAPKVTDQWYDTASDVLYEYINDGTSTYWVDTTSPAFAGGVVANVAISGTLVPVANVTYDIGTNTVYFRNTYTQNLYTNNRLTASNMPSGAVVQTIMSTSLGGSATTGTSYSDIALANVVIQPSSANSKVLIIATGTSSFTPLAAANLTASTQLVRTASSIQVQEYSANIAGGGVGGSSAVAFSYLDSPNTTSPVTYKLQQKISNSSSTLTSSNMWIIAMEIAVP